MGQGELSYIAGSSYKIKHTHDLWPGNIPTSEYLPKISENLYP